MSYASQGQKYDIKKTTRKKYEIVGLNSQTHKELIRGHIDCLLPIKNIFTTR